jgi:hypothetical protein
MECCYALVRRHPHFAIYVALLVALALLVSPSSTTLASPTMLATDSPARSMPTVPTLGPNPCAPAASVYDEASGNCIQRSRALDSGVAPQSRGGPDDFGYRWDDSVPLAWVDATSGTDTGMGGDSSGTAVSISLPFAFKYYERTYNSLYVVASGYLSFDGGSTEPMQDPFPSPRSPNNVIAPFWTPITLASSGPANRVYYASGGASPNHFVVVEWNQVQQQSRASSGFTFEAILYENGDIVFQYLDMSDLYWCETSGIEDSTGDDGLAFIPSCARPRSNVAVRFSRPAPAVRLPMRSLFQGRFVAAGDVVTYPLSIRNTGELGADAAELSVLSAWPASLWQADGVTPLTDSDGDGLPDTGALAQAQSITVTVMMQVPLSASVGANSTASVTARSRLNPAVIHSARLESAVPAPFAQVFQDGANDSISLYLVQPSLRKLIPTDLGFGHDIAVAQTGDGGFVYAWRGESKLQYMIVDRYGRVVRPPTWLGDPASATDGMPPALVVAGDGHIGILWSRRMYRYIGTQVNDNIYFAVLNSSGDVLTPETNITGNDAWGSGSDENIPIFYHPRIVATNDDHFVLAWQEEHLAANYQWVDDIYYAVRSSTGSQIRPVTKLTNATPGSNGYWQPALASLSGNAALVAYESPGNVYAALLDSNGLLVLAPVAISETGSGIGSGMDAVQLSDGTISLAWSCYWNSRKICVAMLNNTLDLTWGPTMLSHLAAVSRTDGGNDYVSMAADNAGHAILTWAEDGGWPRHLYYALVSSTGAIVTPPTIYLTSQAPDPYITTSYEGYGNTAYDWQPATAVDAQVYVGARVIPGSPGGASALSITFRNDGPATGTGVVLTAMLDISLTYLYDTSGITPTISGSDVLWSLPDLAFKDAGNFVVYVAVPEADMGTRFPVTLTLGAAEPDANPLDNTDTADVMVARSLYLPVIVSAR